MKNILFPTDFSENAENAIFYGLSLYKDEACKFTLLNSFYIPYTNQDVPLSVSDVSVDAAEESFVAFIRKIKLKFPDHSFDIETEFLVGDVPGTVATVVKRKNIDLVVMGTRGASGISEILVGSNTSGVVHLGDCPVLVIPEGAKFVHLNQIVLAIDFKNTVTTSCLDPMLKLAEQHHSDVVLLHVTKENEEGSESETILHMKRHLKGIVNSYLSVYDGSVPDEIEKYIHKHRPDLLVMVHHKLKLFNRIFHKSVVKKMTLHTEVPLLVMYDTNK